MSFEPMGGFPPIVRINDKPDEKTLESRGFPRFITTDIVSIKKILEKKKDDPFIASGIMEDEGAVDFAINNLLFNKPHEYDKILYNEN